MNRIHTFRDLFRHFDWSARRVLDAAGKLPEEALDREHPMGLSTLRKTLWHIYGAQHLWLGRIAGVQPTKFSLDDERPSLMELEQRITQSHQSRNALLASLDDAQLDRDIHYTDMKGVPRTSKLGDILLQICNHAMHHHAQAINMIRHGSAGAEAPGKLKPPRVDYLFMYYENPDWPAPHLSATLLRNYLAYTDWARHRVMNLILELDDAMLDRPFEMGMGSVRKNMVHTLAAETFWLRNWQGQIDHSFPTADERLSPQDLFARFRQIGSERSMFLSQKTDEHLIQPVEARTPDGRVLSFPLGVTMMQLCFHGTHHRAQTINMLRQCGTSAPPMDYIVMKRES